MSAVVERRFSGAWKRPAAARREGGRTGSARAGAHGESATVCRSRGIKKHPLKL